MMRTWKARGLAGVGLVVAALFFWANPASAQQPCNDCYSCQKHHCPPHYKHCREGPPRICWEHGCPRPICVPCTAPNWGYYQTCWTPWPWPPDWSHCPVQPPASVVFPGLAHPGSLPSDMPEPRKLRSGF